MLLCSLAVLLGSSSRPGLLHGFLGALANAESSPLIPRVLALLVEAHQPGHVIALVLLLR